MHFFLFSQLLIKINPVRINFYLLLCSVDVLIHRCFGVQHIQIFCRNLMVRKKLIHSEYIAKLLKTIKFPLHMFQSIVNPNLKHMKGNG